MFDYNIIGERIKFYRHEMALTQIELAKKSGLSQGEIWKLENNKIEDVSLHTLNKVATGLNVPVDYLFINYELEKDDPSNSQIDIIMKKINTLSNENKKKLIKFLQLYKQLQKTDD